MAEYRRDDFDPPAPIAEVALTNPASGVTCDGVPMLLDTGADVSVLPRAAIQRIGLVSATARYEVAGFGGGTVLLDAIDLKLTFLGHAFQGRFLVVDQDYGILGRNVLNAERILFDGPELTWTKQG